MSDFVAHLPNSTIVGHIQLLLKIQHRDPFLIGRHQKNGPKPFAQGDFTSMKNSARCDRCLLVTVVAFENLLAWFETIAIFIAVGTMKTFGPAHLNQVIETGLFV